MAVTDATFSFVCKVTEEIVTGRDWDEDPDVLHEITGLSGSLSPTSSVPVTTVWSDTGALSGGAATLDLTSLSNGNLTAVSMSGLKVQLVVIKASASNTQPLTVADGASNGYTLFGDSSGQVTLKPGAILMMHVPDSLPDVGSSAKTLDLSSAMAAAAYSILLVAG